MGTDKPLKTADLSLLRRLGINTDVSSYKFNSIKQISLTTAQAQPLRFSALKANHSNSSGINGPIILTSTRSPRLASGSLTAAGKRMPCGACQISPAPFSCNFTR